MKNQQVWAVSQVVYGVVLETRTGNFVSGRSNRSQPVGDNLSVKFISKIYL